jgi:hypothetical protein
MRRFLSSRSWVLLLIFALGVSVTSSATPPSRSQWIGTWAASPEAQPNSIVMSADTTYREIVHLSAGGDAFRIVVTNEFGLEPLTIASVGVAISAGDSLIETAGAKILSFGGHASITLPAGTMTVSDPVNMTVPALANFAVSLFVPAQTITQSTLHSYALQTNYLAAGNVVATKTLTDATETSSWYFLKGLK